MGRRPEHMLLFQVVLAGAFYPNYFTFGQPDEEMAVRELAGKDPKTTVVVGDMEAVPREQCEYRFSNGLPVVQLVPSKCYVSAGLSRPLRDLYFLTSSSSFYRLPFYREASINYLFRVNADLIMCCFNDLRPLRALH